MPDHRQGLAVVNGKHRHVVVVKLFLLIVAEHDHDIGLGFRQRIPQAIGIIRTGDTIQYANMVLVSGR